MSAFVSRLDTDEAPERDVAHHMARRGLLFSPLLVLACGALWGLSGVASSAYAVVLVIVNLLFAAFLITATARISLGLMMGAVLFGYLIRLGVIFVAFYVVRDAPWMSVPAFGVTVIVTQLGLLLWELKYVSASLAFPGLKPTPQGRSSL